MECTQKDDAATFPNKRQSVLEEKIAYRYSSFIRQWSKMLQVATYCKPNGQLSFVCKH